MKETIKNNKLIAEFMGWRFNKSRKVYHIPQSNGFPFKGKIEDLKYHNSWDWLMPVVEKIESIKLGDLENLLPDDKHFNCKAGIVINGTYCNIFIQSTMRLVDNFVESNRNTKIEATYKAVVEFIKWYNKEIGEAQ